MTVIKKLLSELRLIKFPFVGGLLCLLIASLSSQLSPLLLQEMIDKDLTPLAGDGASFSQENFLLKVSAYFILLMLASVFFYLSSRVLMHCANRVTAELRNRAFDKMQDLPISYFDHRPAGKIATRIVNDTETLRNQFYSTLLSQVFINLLEIVVIYLVLFSLDPRIGLALLLFIPIFYSFQIIYKRLTDQPMKDFYEARSEVNTQVNESMNGSAIIQLFQQEEMVLENFDQTAKKMKVADDRITFANSVASWTLSEFLKYAVIAAILTILSYQFLADRLGITVGRLFVYINYISMIFDLLGMLVRQLPNVQRSLETGQRVLELLDQVSEDDQTKEIQIDQGQVIFDKVSFAYETDKPVLTDINFRAQPGQTVALVGHTGSGKSSIMNLLFRFYDPQDGQVVIDGQPIRNYSRESLRRQMGIVLQDPYLFSGTIASNIRMENPDISDQDIIDSLEKVGAGHLLSRLEKGIEEEVVERGAAFSSGERQLISFARTLAANPKILILDEATSHIDTETEQVIQKAMEVVMSGRTSFIIAHRLSTIQTADLILVLDHGRILERGNHQELLKQKGLYADMHRIQSKVQTS